MQPYQSGENVNKSNDFRRHSEKTPRASSNPTNPAMQSGLCGARRGLGHSNIEQAHANTERTLRMWLELWLSGRCGPLFAVIGCVEALPHPILPGMFHASITRRRRKISRWAPYVVCSNDHLTAIRRRERARLPSTSRPRKRSASTWQWPSYRGMLLAHVAEDSLRAPFLCRRERDLSLSHQRLDRAAAGDCTTL
jgi:hypothetical protein